MKKIFTVLIMMIVSAFSVLATTTTLSDPELMMGYSDVRTVQFCNVGPGPIVDVFISPVCRDTDGIFGCGAGDELNPSGFSIVSDMPTLMVGECASLTLTTDLAPEDGGVFYYTANGQVGGTTVGSETGKVFIPEFTTIGAGLILMSVGVYTFRKRKN